MEIKKTDSPNLEKDTRSRKVYQITLTVFISDLKRDVHDTLLSHLIGSQIWTKARLREPYIWYIHVDNRYSGVLALVQIKNSVNARSSKIVSIICLYELYSKVSGSSKCNNGKVNGQATSITIVHS